MFGKKNNADDLIPKKKKKKGVPKKKLLAILMLLLAFLISFVVLPMFYAEKEATEEVYVAKTVIQEGDEITKESIELKEIGTFGLSSYFADGEIDSLIGERASFTMIKGDVTTKEKLGGQAKETATSITKAGKSLVTVSIKTNASGLATHLKAGDIVSVWCLTSNEYEDITPTLLQGLERVEVYSAENSSGYSTESASSKGDDEIVSTITFIAENKAQTQALLKAEYSNGLHIELVER